LGDPLSLSSKLTQCALLRCPASRGLFLNDALRERNWVHCSLLTRCQDASTFPRICLAARKQNSLMLETEHSLTLLTIMEIVGPIILAGGLLYGIIVASRRRGAQKSRGDAATRRLYQQKDSEIK
jgi:hypothetical protein